MGKGRHIPSRRATSLSAGGSPILSARRDSVKSEVPVTNWGLPLPHSRIYPKGTASSKCEALRDAMVGLQMTDSALPEHPHPCLNLWKKNPPFSRKLGFTYLHRCVGNGSCYPRLQAGPSGNASNFRIRR